MATVIMAHSGPKQKFNSPITLYKDGMRKTNGTRSVSRKQIRNVIFGSADRVTVVNRENGRTKTHPSKASSTRMYIGCHVISGPDFKAVREWALNG